jgi:SAM-dependent methyltransferase
MLDEKMPSVNMDPGSAQALAQRLIRQENELTLKHDYCGFHARRYQFLLSVCDTLKPDSRCSVLDIGRSQLSALLADRYRRVVTLGLPLGDFAHERTNSGNGATLAAHVVFDLNDRDKTAIPITEDFDLIVFAETIEHLHSAPEIALYALGRLLKPEGVLVCQTPNAASLERRFQLLLGRNPFERLRSNRLNPGHFREYTRAELIDIGQIAGLSILKHDFVDYFPHSGPLQFIRSTLREMIPEFRSGQTIIYTKGSID